MCFHQDGVTCHTIPETTQSLHESFPCRVIPRLGDRNWLPRSSCLMPLDLFFEIFSSLWLIPTSPRLPTSWGRKSSAVSTKFSHVYAKRSWKVSSKGCVDVPAKSWKPITPFAIPYKNLQLSTMNLCFLLKLRDTLYLCSTGLATLTPHKALHSNELWRVSAYLIGVSSVKNHQNDDQSVVKVSNKHT